MPLDPALVTELRNILRSFGAAHSPASIPNGGGKALEAWLLMKLAFEAQRSGSWHVELCNGAGHPLGAGASFKSRGGPGKMPALNHAASGFIRLSPNWIPHPYFTLELHGSLQWLGRSGAKHECDVSVLPSVVGEAIRHYGGGYPQGLPIVSLECKDKSGPGQLDEMRECLARMFDLAYVCQTPLGGYNRIFHAPTYTYWGKRSSMYRSYYNNSLFAIVRVGTFQTGAQQLSGHYSISQYPDIYSPHGTSVDRMVTKFLNVINSIQSLG